MPVFQWKHVLVPEGQTFERRSDPRVPVNLQATWRRDGESLFLQVCDLGRGGLRFRSPRPLPLRETLELTLRLSERTTITVGATVTWCRGCPETQGLYEGGVCFTRISPGSHLDLLGYLTA